MEDCYEVQWWESYEDGDRLGVPTDVKIFPSTTDGWGEADEEFQRKIDSGKFVHAQISEYEDGEGTIVREYGIRMKEREIRWEEEMEAWRNRWYEQKIRKNREEIAKIQKQIMENRKTYAKIQELSKMKIDEITEMIEIAKMKKTEITKINENAKISIGNKEEVAKMKIQLIEEQLKNLNLI